jgi:uroporphyrinogen decarboxylase
VNHRERVAVALEHREPDRVPIDLGGANLSSIHRIPYGKLVKRLGVKVDIEITAKTQQLAKLDESVLRIFDVDFRHCSLKKGFYSGAEDRLDDPSGRPYFVDAWGIKWGKNPYYYDMIAHPLDNLSIGDLDEYPWPDPKDPARYEGLREEVRDAFQTTDYALVADPIGGGIFECAWWLRGFEKFIVDMYKNPDFAQALLDKVLALYMEFYSRYLDEVGDYVQVVELGDDVGAQNGPIMSPALLRKYIKPRWKKLYDLMRSKTKAKIFHHSCGSIYPFIPDLIEVGVDILNPIQPLAANMDIGKIKEQFGDKLTLHGGVDIQRVLPLGTPNDVAEEVKRVIRSAAHNGGYILAGAHNIQPDSPVDNIVTLLEAARKFGAYPIDL